MRIANDESLEGHKNSINIRMKGYKIWENMLEKQL
jgi:hypothetical protein